MKLTTMLKALCPAVYLLAPLAQGVSVPATGPVDSGILITPGSYLVTATGTWRFGSAPWNVTTATGQADQADGDMFYAGANKGGLVAYIGDSAPGHVFADAGTAGYYAILDGTQQIHFKQGGKLWLVINDDALSGAWGDNGGELTVTVNMAPLLSIRVSQVQLCWPTETNQWYQLQYRSTLTGDSWVPLMTNWFQGNGSRFCTNDAVADLEKRFYQVAMTNAPPQP